MFSIAITNIDKERLLFDPYKYSNDVVQICGVRNAFDAKRIAVSICKNKNVALCDHDNYFDEKYFLGIENLFKKKNTIYCPSIAGDYNFSEFEGLCIEKNNIRQYIDNSNFIAMLLCGNYVFNRDWYMYITEGAPMHNVLAEDCMYTHYLNLMNGGTIHVTDKLKYIHNTRNDGYFSKNNLDSWKNIEFLKKRILDLELFDE